MNDRRVLERLEQADLTHPQQRRLLALVKDVLKRAIDVRSPKNRPPGKAGLRAEKGYYRLLYLESEFQERVNPHDTPLSQAPPVDWDGLTVMLRQLADLPELKSEITRGIESALTAVMDKKA